ncbi:flavodoxin reductase [Roseivirga echinicomitans]
MEQHIISLQSIEKITPDVIKIKTDKPNGYTFKVGQATEVGINKEGWEKELRPFTFTCLPQDNYLEFIIKTYPSHKGVTAEMLNLKPKDELLIGDAWGTIGYKGPGAFIAGGAGITPFIAIFRQLQADKSLAGNKLIFANKTKADIIHKAEFTRMLGSNFINILSDEKTKEHEHGFISRKLLKNYDLTTCKHIYLCGPQPMMEAVEQQLHELGIDKKRIVKEEF